MFNDIDLKDAEITPREVLTLLFALALTTKDTGLTQPEDIINKATVFADKMLEAK